MEEPLELARQTMTLKRFLGRSSTATDR